MGGETWMGAAVVGGGGRCRHKMAEVGVGCSVGHQSLVVERDRLQSTMGGRFCARWGMLVAEGSMCQYLRPTALNGRHHNSC